jgi:CPW-WPC domain-containing protein
MREGAGRSFCFACLDLHRPFPIVNIIAERSPATIQEKHVEGSSLAKAMPDMKHYMDTQYMSVIKSSLQSLKLTQGISSKVSHLRGHVQADPLLAAAKIAPSEVLEIGQDADAAASVDEASDTIIGTGCASCVAKDFSEPCPMDWRGGSADGTCTAPPGYDGACQTSLTFAAASAEKKAEVELICGVCWPCKGL